MGRAFLISLSIWLVAGPGLAQPGLRGTQDQPSDNRIVLGASNQLLADGANAIRAGSYDEGIRLTKLGLERGANTSHDEAAALSNICAAYAGMNAPDLAIEYCSQSLSINSSNWRAFSNRSYAYWLKGMYSEATFDLDAAVAINPRARQVLQIRGMINESGLRPRVTVEDHQ